MNEPKGDSQIQAQRSGADPNPAPGGAIVGALYVFDRFDRATVDFVTASIGRAIAAGPDLMSRQIAALAAIGVAMLDSVEKIGCRAATSNSNVAESIITSIGGLFRRLIVAAGEAARTVLDQIDETAHQVLDNGRETFERALDSASSVGEASARFAERVVIRSLDAGSEVGGALRAALWRDGAASIADRPVAPSASEHARVAS